MSRENDEAVLRAIGQITVKINDNDPNELKFVLKTIHTSEGFLRSEYGRAYIKKITARIESLTGDKGPSVYELIQRSDEKTESLFRDIDDSLFQVASQRTSESTQKLTWVVLALSVINTVMVFFVALFVWKLNMG